MNVGSDIATRLQHYLQRHGRQPAAHVIAALGISRATLARASRANPNIVRTGQARATQYALRAPIRGEWSWPLYRVDAQARVIPLGELVALQRGEFHVRLQHANPVLLRAPFQLGVFPDLPWFIEDLRPNGFLGRTFAHRHAARLRLPTDIRLWNAEHIVTALLDGGSTQSGDLILGDAALQDALRWRATPTRQLGVAERAQRYPEFANELLEGDAPGSSPGGEQAKFTAMLEDSAGLHEVIVKFSPAERSAVAIRWADLLRCENLANTILRSRGIACATTEILESDGQVFLQSTRFDRSVMGGRLGFVTLASIDAAFYGRAGDPWWHVADTLQRDGWLNAEDADQLRRVSWFGLLIANTDMHMGNFALQLGDELPLAPCPVYDMLPMQLRPSGMGTLERREYVLPLPVAGQHRHWCWGAEAALAFWIAVEETTAMSADVRQFAVSASQAIRTAMPRFC